MNALHKRLRLLTARDPRAADHGQPVSAGNGTRTTATISTTATGSSTVKIAHGSAGFSLIEVVVAIFIFALISTGTAYTMMSVLQVSRDSRARHVATNLAAAEIDLARDTADLLTLVDVNRANQTFNGDTFHVSRSTQWVASTGLDDACGTGDANLSYKRVNITVSWDRMRAGSAPVHADTVVTPGVHTNNPTRGTILVSVRGASGDGVSGATVTVAPAAVPHGATSRLTAVSDAQGCAFLLDVVPGNYTVTTNKTGYVDSLAQSANPVVASTVAAGESSAASFEFDNASKITLTYGSNSAASTLYLPRTLDTSHITSDGDVVVTRQVAGGSATASNSTRTRLVPLFPYGAGYQSIAGAFVPAAPAGATSPTCLSVDPAAWPETSVTGVIRVGIRPGLAASVPGGEAIANVPMGIATLNLAADATVTAVSATPSTALAATGDPGCRLAMSYSFGKVPRGATIALPFGSWTISADSVVLGEANLSITSRGVRTGAVVTFDPREVR